jgi:hypothetical protein
MAIVVWFEEIGDRVLGGEGRSLFEVKEIGDRFVGGVGAIAV